MNKEDNWWILKTDLSDEAFRLLISMVFTIKEKRFIHFENANNRSLIHRAGKKEDYDNT